MIIPPADIHWFADLFTETSREMLDTWEENGKPAIADEPSPEILHGAMEQLIQLLKVIDSGHAYPEDPQTELGEEPDITELGDYGLSILEEFITLAEAFNLQEQIGVWEQLSVALGRWIALHDGEITVLSSLVNGLARIANNTAEQAILESLFTTMTEICDAVSMTLMENSEMEDQFEPWRILVFNRAIVATRIFSPRLMDEAFSTLTDLFPDEAPDFFHEGMEQMDIQDYPAEVREIMEKYYQDWPVRRVLH